MTSDARLHLDTFGYVLLPTAFDARALIDEFDAVHRDAFDDGAHVNSGSAGNRFRYVPTMCEHTPVSLALTTALAHHATALLGSEVIPGRSKATTYFGATDWHRDSEGAVRSIGMVCYLDPLDTSSGALQVVPGSQHPDFGAALAASGSDLPGVAVPTQPGDVIVFDERLYHCSSNGERRRQWRVDFVADDGDDEQLRAYFAGHFAPGWDGGYDVDRYPSFGPAWCSLDARWTLRLDELGALAAAAAEEDAVRRRRRG